jgi:hypothetical protein
MYEEKKRKGTTKKGVVWMKREAAKGGGSTSPKQAKPSWVARAPVVDSRAKRRSLF